MNSGPTIDYDALQQEAMRGLVRSVLTETAKTGLPGEHHFYISFNTRAPGVTLSRRLKEKYPREMTIVLQHRFWGLTVSDDRFEVNLTFDGIPERLVIPFQAIRVFVDPSVRFGLQFEIADIGPEPRVRAEQQQAAGDEQPTEQRDATVSRSSGPRKARPQRKRTTEAASPEKDAKPEQAVAEPERRPERVAAPHGAPAAAEFAPAEPVPQQQNADGAAKVVSLDAFRKR